MFYNESKACLAGTTSRSSVSSYISFGKRLFLNPLLWAFQIIMGSLRRGAAAAALSTLFSFSYGAVPASNSAQSSILSQQAYNLCLYEDVQGIQTKSCSSFGSSGMLPSKTTLTSASATATFIASFLTDYAGLSCGGTIIQTADSQGASATTSVGELGQG
jgi:hypothetical protein